MLGRVGSCAYGRLRQRYQFVKSILAGIKRMHISFREASPTRCRRRRVARRSPQRALHQAPAPTVYLQDVLYLNLWICRGFVYAINFRSSPLKLEQSGCNCAVGEDVSLDGSLSTGRVTRPDVRCTKHPPSSLISVD